MAKQVWISVALVSFIGLVSANAAGKPGKEMASNDGDRKLALIPSKSVEAPGGESIAEKNLSQHFGTNQGCLIIQNLKNGREEAKVGGRFCEERQFTCSTFKVPLALMAADQGIIKSEKTTFKWDGVDKGMANWNRDQTAESWMRDSAVWVSKELTPKIGEKKLASYLKDFRYGNLDMSGGLQTAWLSSSLTISPIEQVDFLKRLWIGELKVSKRALELTKKLTFIETSADGAILHGKTGSCMTPAFRVGWFVGFVKKGDAEYVFALDFKDTKKPLSRAFAGPEARETFKKIARELDLL